MSLVILGKVSFRNLFCLNNRLMFKKIGYPKKRLRYLGLAIGVFIAVKVISTAWLFIYPEYKTRTQFTVNTSPLTHTYDLFDLGVVDANGDRNLDLFTLNHSARQNFLLGRDGTYQQKLSEWNLDQDYQFPGLEDTDVPPKFDRPGLYIYRQNFLLHLYSHQINSSVEGKLNLSLPVTVKSQKNSQVSIKEQLSSGVVATSVNFKLQNNAHLVLEDFPEVPHTFEVSQDVPLSSIYLGWQKLPPQQHNFTLMWRDRHSMAWSDVNGDGKQDVFIGRGGIRGKISQLPETLNDELFIQQQDTFVEQIEQFNLVKDGCPARKSAWVDYDGDSDLDLYISCGRLGDDTAYPNQLYQRQDNLNNLINVANQVGLDLPGAGYFQWLDVDGDNDQDLIAAQGEQTTLYVNQADSFQPQPIPGSTGGTLVKLAVADFDGDGDFDGYGVMEGGKNQLLIDADGILQFQAAADYGLPETGLDANWVDYDNDGLVELHVIPYGLYQQSNDRFQETGLLDLRRPVFSIWNARSVWFDADNDGDRDLLVAYQQTPSILQPQPSLIERIKDQIFKRDTSRIWQSVLYKNRGGNNHWLQLNLVGASGNAEAIGAMVSVETEQGIQSQQVGASPGSRYSQGEYRVYFGLGNNSQISKIQVRWSDGSYQELKEVAGDRILTITKNQA